MLLFTMPATRAKTLAALLLAPVLAGAALLWMGYMQPGATVLGVRLSRPAPVVPANAWLDELKRSAAEHELRDWQVSGRGELGDTSNPRQAYYRAALIGTRDGEPITVDVELLAADKGEWRLSKWSER